MIDAYVLDFHDDFWGLKAIQTARQYGNNTNMND